MLENGDADLMLGPNRTPEREKFLLFADSATFPAEDKVFIVANPLMAIHSLQDLQGKRIDVLAGAAYHPDIDRSGLLNKHELNSYSQGLQRLLRNHSDLVIIPEAQADYLLQTLKLPLLKSPFHLRGPPPIWPGLVAPMISRWPYDSPPDSKKCWRASRAKPSARATFIRGCYCHSFAPQYSAE